MVMRTIVNKIRTFAQVLEVKEVSCALAFARKCFVTPEIKTYTCKRRERINYFRTIPYLKYQLCTTIFNVNRFNYFKEFGTKLSILKLHFLF